MLHAGCDPAVLNGERGGFLGHVVLPLAHGNPSQFISEARFDEHTDAIAWAVFVAECGAVGQVGVTVVDDTSPNSPISLRIDE